MGPTAAGKTTAAVELVQRYPFEIISADSALVYRGLDIGSAKPDAATLAIAPHRLIDQVDPADAYSAGRFREDALLAMAEITAAGRIPLLVGGTGLYLRALDRGLARMPAADAAVRAQIDAQAAASGWPAMHQQLAQVDPAAAARIHPNDSQRIQRALEVFSISGQPISALQQQERSQACADTVYRVAWSRSRDQLNNNIEKRFKLMMENGFLSEVEALYRRGDLTTDHPAIRAVGYRQLWRHLDGEIDLGQAVQDAITATRRLAKRQLTWLRAEPGVVWLDPDSPSAAKRLNQIAARVVQSCRY
ncbi:MAG: tRNA (adenosine(37)-N6)-dimethylallyltransferase MiaA [Gammaproteobacteria bacterium]|nr:tRNA (adenosine(37)-N6)-dimethylallyltransferase MiaA [Gammaproteobacteria bacterium]